MRARRKSTCRQPDRPATIRRVTATRKPLTRSDLAPLARAALGPTRTLTAVARLRGGTRKGVYRLAFDDGTTAVAYIWSADEDYWDAGPSDSRDPFSHATGLDLFTAAHDRLNTAGVRTPASCTPTPRTLTSRPTRRSWRTCPAAAWRSC